MMLSSNLGRWLGAVLVGMCLMMAGGSAGAQAPGAVSAVPAAVAQPAVVPAPPADVAKPDQSYRLGAGDVVEVSILGRADFNTRARLGQDGAIQLPYLNSIPAADRTTNELAEQIRKGLEAGGYFEKPVVRVEIVGYASRYVVVLGAVGQPGLVPLDRAYRLSEILARVGGKQTGGADYIVVTKADGVGQRYPIAALATGGGDDDPMVVAGDKIFIPTAENEVFYVSGAVKAPGVYPLTPGLSFRMAVARSGGVTPEGNAKSVTVHRGAAKGKKMNLDEKVETGDVIVVGERMF